MSSCNNNWNLETFSLGIVCFTRPNDIQKPSLQQQQQQSRRVADISKDLCQAATFWTPIHKRGYWCHVKTSSSFLQAKNRFLHYQTRKLEEVVNSLSEIPKAKHAKVSKYYKVCMLVVRTKQRRPSKKVENWIPHLKNN